MLWGAVIEVQGRAPGCDGANAFDSGPLARPLQAAARVRERSALNDWLARHLGGNDNNTHNTR